MKKEVILILILAAIILLASIFFIFKNPRSDIRECQSNSDCVPAGCCHPDSCTKISDKPNCSGSICSQVCSSSLDCGAGYCGCIKNKCAVVPNE